MLVGLINSKSKIRMSENEILKCANNVPIECRISEVDEELAVTDSFEQQGEPTTLHSSMEVRCRRSLIYLV